MEKDTIVELMQKSENDCRILFDKLQTLQQEESQFAVELERTRGDFRTYAKLVNEWPEIELSIPGEEVKPKEGKK